jgi:hypothetical protein
LHDLLAQVLNLNSRGRPQGRPPLAPTFDETIPVYQLALCNECLQLSVRATTTSMLPRTLRKLPTCPSQPNVPDLALVTKLANDEQVHLFRKQSTM